MDRWARRAAILASALLRLLSRRACPVPRAQRPRGDKATQCVDHGSGFLNRGPCPARQMPAPAAGDPGSPTAGGDDYVPVHQLYPLHASKLEPLIHEKICSLDYVSRVGYIDEGHEEVFILVVHDYDPDRLLGLWVLNVT